MKNKFFIFGVFISLISSVTFYYILLFSFNKICERVFRATSKIYVDNIIFAINSNYEKINDDKHRISELLKTYKNVNYLFLNKDLKSIDSNVSRNEIDVTVRILSERDPKKKFKNVIGESISYQENFDFSNSTILIEMILNIDEENNYLIIKLSNESMVQVQNYKHFFLSFSTIALFTLEFIFLITLTSVIKKRINSFKNISLNLTQENMGISNTFSEKFGDEFDRLADIFSEITMKINGFLKMIDEGNGNLSKMTTSLKRQKNEMQLELDMGRKVQSVLIRQFNERLDDIYIFADSITSKELGGDYFHVHDFKNNKVAISIGDVSGKGTGSALVMSSVLSLIQQKETISLSPSKILSTVNENLCSIFEFKRKSKLKYFVTSLQATLTRSNDSFILALSNAGHLPPLLFRNNDFIDFNLSNMALGVTKKIDFNEIEIVLEVNDYLVFYTDGIIEQTNSVDEQFGLERFKKSIINNAKKKPEYLFKQIMNDIKEFSGSNIQIDDITIVLVKIDH